MLFFLLGLAILALSLLVINWLAHTTAENVKKMFGAFSAILLLVLTILLLATGRFLAALPSAIMAITVYRRYRKAFKIYQGARDWMGRGPGQTSSGDPSSSEVRTSHLSMFLDHRSASLDGEVLQGHFQGKKISEMDEADLFRLLEELLSVDGEGARLLETYLDRHAAPDWRQRYDGPPAGAKSRSADTGGPLTYKDAYRVLGLNAGASEDEIKTAHKKLMLKFHPDQGGSDYLASKINQAKELLLGK